MKINQVVTEGLVGVTTQSHIKEKLEKLSKESKQKNIYLNRYVNFTDADSRMIWVTAIIDDKLKKAAEEGHHEYKLVLRDVLSEVRQNCSKDNNREKFEKEVLRLAKSLNINRTIGSFLIPKYRNETIYSFDLLKLFIDLLPDDAYSLKRYLCFKYEPILLQCEITNSKKHENLANLVITFAW